MTTGTFICIVLIVIANVVQMISTDRTIMQIFKMLVETNRALLELGIKVKDIQEELEEDE